MHKKVKTISFILLITFLMSISFGSIGFASLSDEVRKHSDAGGGALITEIDSVGSSVVDFIRNIAGVAGVILIIWAGIIFGTAHGDPNKIALAKKVLGCFVICLVMVFAAEKIVGALLGLIGAGS